jgi:hypothetical protein
MAAGAKADAGAMDSTARTVSLSALDAGAIAAWQGLADRAAEPNPYYRPEFVQPATTGSPACPWCAPPAGGGCGFPASPRGCLTTR